MRPKDITHKALGGSLAITADVRTLLQLHSAPKIQLYRRGMSRVSLIAQHFVRLRRRSAVFSQAVNFDAVQWQLVYSSSGRS